MSNPFQEQFLKAGLVSKQQVQKANKSKRKQQRQQQNQKQAAVDETRLKAKRAAEEKARRDRELNQRREEQARKKAISAEINQLIKTHRIPRKDDECDIAYHFEHQKKVKTIYVDESLRRQIIDGKLGIARIEGRYELVPRATAEKIRQRNDKRVILFDKESDTGEGYDDPRFQVPDDLIW